jgi:hypothetical protein
MPWGIRFSPTSRRQLVCYGTGIIGNKGRAQAFVAALLTGNAMP